MANKYTENSFLYETFRNTGWNITSTLWNIAEIIKCKENTKRLKKKLKTSIVARCRFGFSWVFTLICNLILDFIFPLTTTSRETGPFGSRLYCGLPSSSVLGFFRQKYQCCHFLLQGIFLTWGLNPCLPCLHYCRQILHPLSHWGKQGLLTKPPLNKKE